MEAGKYFPSTKALILLSESYDVSIDWILKGGEDGPNAQSGSPDRATKKYAPELAAMIAHLVTLWKTENPDIKGWMKIQFQRAFPDFEAGLKKPPAASHDRPKDDV